MDEAMSDEIEEAVQWAIGGMTIERLEQRPLETETIRWFQRKYGVSNRELFQDPLTDAHSEQLSQWAQSSERAWNAVRSVIEWRMRTGAKISGALLHHTFRMLSDSRFPGKAGRKKNTFRDQRIVAVLSFLQDEYGIAPTTVGAEIVQRHLTKAGHNLTDAAIQKVWRDRRKD